MGAFELLLPTEPAGSGDASGGVVEASVIFEQLGAHLATGPLLWTAISAPLLADAATGAIRVAGIDVTRATHAPYVIEHARESDVIVLVYDDRVEQCSPSALDDPIDGEPFDPLTPAIAYPGLPNAEPIGGSEEAERLRLVGCVLAAAELVGVAQGALDIASSYAQQRHQFGVPIGSFQAVKHLLADMYVRVELARSATYAAAAVLDDDRAGDGPTAASTAKVLAGEAGIANGRTAVQVLGGMGFTWEMTPHYFLKRAWVLEQTFGTGDTHAERLGAALEADARTAAAAWT
jgi:hypothetical protein